jgi:hypothetical protein
MVRRGDSVPLCALIFALCTSLTTQLFIFALKQHQIYIAFVSR